MRDADTNFSELRELLLSFAALIIFRRKQINECKEFQVRYAYHYRHTLPPHLSDMGENDKRGMIAHFLKYLGTSDKSFK